MSDRQYIDAVNAVRIDRIRKGLIDPDPRDIVTLERITKVGAYMRDKMNRDAIKNMHPDWDVDWLAAMAVKEGIA